MAELSHPPASVAESRHDDLYCRRRYGMPPRQKVDQFSVRVSHVAHLFEIKFKRAARWDAWQPYQADVRTPSVKAVGLFILKR